jgi:hypothetical protein
LANDWCVCVRFRACRKKKKGSSGRILPSRSPP